jgi:hypothetical protein
MLVCRVLKIERINKKISANFAPYPVPGQDNSSFDLMDQGI